MNSRPVPLRCGVAFLLLALTTLQLGPCPVANAAPPSWSPSGLTTMGAQEIVAAVTAGMRSYAAALGTLQKDRIMAHYVEGPDFRLSSDGVVYTRETLSEVLAASSTKLSKMDVSWDSIRVTPLGPDAAFVIAPFRRADFAKSGAVEHIRGVATWVWVRQNGQWKMLYGHGDHYPDTPPLQPGR